MDAAIDYAPALPWYRRRRLRGWLIWLLVVAALVGGGWYWGPGVYRRARILYWQHRCMVHVDPPGTVIYTAEWPTPIRLSASAPVETVIPQPDSDSFRAALDLPTWGTTRAVMFLHGRTCASGERLIYMIYADLDMSGLASGGVVFTSECPAWGVSIFQPGSPTADPTICWRAGYNYPNSSVDLRAGAKLRIYAGQPDPSDSAAFTVQYEYDGVSHTAKFRLNAAGNDVGLESVTPPLALK